MQLTKHSHNIFETFRKLFIRKSWISAATQFCSGLHTAHTRGIIHVWLPIAQWTVRISMENVEFPKHSHTHTHTSRICQRVYNIYVYNCTRSTVERAINNRFSIKICAERRASLACGSHHSMILATSIAKASEHTV